MKTLLEIIDTSDCPNILGHGGKRENSGRKKKEETETTGFRINSEALNKCRVIYGRTLNSKVNAYIKRLAKSSTKEVIIK